MKFPKDPGYVCKNEIGVLRLGSVTANNYAFDLATMSEAKPLDEMVNGEDSLFVNSVTSEYLDQFSDVFDPDEGVINYGESILVKKANMKYSKARLKRVLESFEKFEEISVLHLFMLAHHECLPEQGYHISLENLNTHEKGIEWTLQVGEKIWFNFSGWYKILESLYGRGNV